MNKVRQVQEVVHLATSELPIVVGPPDSTLKEVNLAPEDFLVLIGKIRFNNSLSRLENSKWRKALKLVEPTTLPDHPDDWDITAEPTEDGNTYSVRRDRDISNPELEKMDYGQQIQFLKTHRANEADWQLVFPMRVKKENSLRRLWLSDCYDLGVDLSVLECFSSFRSYVFVSNMLVYQSVCDFDIIRWFHKRGALQNANTYIAFCKRISTILKATVYSDRYLPLVEAGVMCGFRLLPDPTFDIVEATKEAATGLGLRHSSADGLAKEYGWMNCLNELKTTSRVTRVNLRPVSFAEFIDDFPLWSTSGSSSYGRFIFSVESEKHNIKARKLLLPFITKVSTLLLLCKEERVTKAESIVKSELLKIRVAVASDVEFYLLWAYIHYIYGDLYTDWPGVSLGETVEEEANRIYNMYSSLKDCYGFPADFEAFDKQPTTLEVACIGQVLVNIANSRMKLPDWLSHEAIYGLLESELRTPRQPNGYIYRYKVLNYLPSGIFITSAVGNGFNCVASMSMLRVVEAWINTPMSNWLSDFNIRGDDSSFIVKHEGICYLLSLAAKMLNYVHAPMKVAVVSQGTEFLRVGMTTEHGCRGYPARVIPSITQRKPWSNEPWDPEGIVRTHFSTCMTLQRRRVKGLQLWNSLSRVWSRRRNLPISVLAASNIDGGLGLGQFEVGHVSVVPPISTLVEVKVNAEITDWVPTWLREKGLSYGFELGNDAIRGLSNDKLVGGLTTADVPEYIGTAASKYRELVSKIEVKDRKRMPLNLNYKNQIDMILCLVTGFKTPDSLFNFIKGLGVKYFNCHRDKVEKVQFRRLAARYQPELPEDPIFSRDARELSLRFCCARSVAEDWLLGQTPSMCFSYCHPSTFKYLTVISAYLVEQGLRYGQIKTNGLGSLCRYISWIVGEALTRSELHFLVYSW